MQLRYIQPFSQYVPGDLVEVPDGAAYDTFYLEPAAAIDLQADDADTKLAAAQAQLTELDAKEATPVQFPPAPKEM